MSRSRGTRASRGDPGVPLRWLRNSAGGPRDTRDKPPQTVLATCGAPPGSPRDARGLGREPFVEIDEVSADASVLGGLRVVVATERRDNRRKLRLVRPNLNEDRRSGMRFVQTSMRFVDPE